MGKKVDLADTGHTIDAGVFWAGLKQRRAVMVQRDADRACSVLSVYIFGGLETDDEILSQTHRV